MKNTKNKNITKEKNAEKPRAKKTTQYKSYDTQLFRRAILIQLDAAHPASVSTSVLSEGMRTAGFFFDEKSLSSEIDYLCQKNYLELSRSQISAAHVRAKLSATGKDYLESEGF